MLDEYAVKLFGKQAFSTYRGYDHTQDATITNEYTTVANRFGHDQARNGLEKIAEDGLVTLAISLGRHSPSAAAGSPTTPIWPSGSGPAAQRDPGGRRPRCGWQSEPAVRPHAERPDGIRHDRGRDHGVGDYNALREGLGLPTYSSFDQFARANGLARHLEGAEGGL